MAKILIVVVLFLSGCATYLDKSEPLITGNGINDRHIKEARMLTRAELKGD